MAARHRAILVGLLTLASCLAGVAWVAARQASGARQELELEARVVAVQFANRIQSGLEQHRIALRQTANFFVNSLQVTEENFYDFASTTFRLTPRCLRISTLDPSLRIRWVYPPEVNHFLVGFDARAHPQVYETLARAQKSREPVLSPPLQLMGGSEGFNLVVPIFRDGRFLGEVVSAFRSAEFFASMMLPEVLQRYDEMVLNSGIPVFASAPFSSPAPSLLPAVERFSVDGSDWEVRVRPREETIAGRLRSVLGACWTLGALLALAAAIGAGLAAGGAPGTGRRRPATSLTLPAARDRSRPDLAHAEKMTALRELVSGVAQEINNPLCTILGYSQLLLGREVPGDVRSRLETLHSEAERMGRIVRDLLTFARRQPPEKKYLGLNGLIEKTLEGMAHRFKAGQIRVEKRLAADLPMTLLDFHQIQQVLLHILNNAEQAITGARRSGTITVATRQVGDRIEARIADDGPGIPPEMQSRIYEPFFTTRRDEKRAGMGLSLCDGIIQEHGGSLRVESAPGEGAEFLIELPVLQYTRDAPGNASTGSSHPLPRLRILVVDGEPAVQDLLVDLLTSKGHKVDTASDLPEALRKIGGDGHDLVIADMKMRHGSGKDIYRAVVEKTPALAGRIIFTAGDGVSREILEFVQDIGNEMLLKPYRIEQVEQAIARAIRN